MERLRGVVERITYANEETGYSVIKVKCKGYMELVTIIGNMTTVNIGAVVYVKGFWSNNPKYGRQFEAKEWEEALPASIYGIEKYLGSGLIKGIGPVYAKKIVHLFQENTLNIIEEEPDRIIEVPGIGKKRVEMIKKAWQDQKEIKNIMLFLQSNGISTSFGSRIYKVYGNESINILKENPYKLADDVYGIGFKTADQLASNLGIDKDSFKRCRAGIFYTLSQFSEEGHCYATSKQLICKCVEILEIEEPKIVMTMDHLLKEKELIKEEPDIIYLPPFFYSERGVARRLKQIMEERTKKSIVNSDKVIYLLEKKENINYDTIQKKAIKQAENSKVMVLTGGPGTGKTTTTHGIISLFKHSGMEVVLAAPTGRAAKRMSEATGMEAKTIHRLLEYKPPHGYKKNEENPIDADVLIIDEASMIDIILMYNLLKAVSDHMILIIVGDIDQLPSVGPGNVLRDIIASEAVPTIKLEHIFRQAMGSKIITNAHRINKGENPDLTGGKSSNFFFIENEENNHVINSIVQLCTKRLPKYYKVDPIQDIQVLTPMQRTETGAANLNVVLQSALNQNTIYLKRGAIEYRLYDKVMQIRNNYDKEVFNGDVGFICNIDTEEKTLKVNFDGREIEYEALELDEIVLAYATTIHKAQGSEYPIVVMPITFSHYIMLQRNLLYTGITRAKKVVVLVGNKKAIYSAVKNNNVKDRNTKLAQRLREELLDLSFDLGLNQANKK
ncbi:ATP-dependent RecD-like DNA helicase [Anaerophilus nitritogenes]|uniref:SF1B family DNA helicase RecD2 n=1 Tax=Anaerophilus nitritogenes TaxID=2498136 RepID=UPI00101D1F5E|nr:ATP-dependent RecD-like DNA helicase [Anaerophilus nitritogenes]